MSWEGPGGHLQRGLADLGLEYLVVEAWRQPLPPLAAFSALIVLGGSPNVDEDDRFPYLAPLKALIREALAAGRPYLGFCLGHQLLAHVLGCRVGPLPQKSIGYAMGVLTPAGSRHPAFRGLPERFPMFKWHGQGALPPVPPEVEILATSDGVPVEALGMAGNPRVVGLQFDNHAAVADVEGWLKADADWALRDSGVVPATLVAEAHRQDEAVGHWFRGFLGNFCRLAGLCT
jgi:GMP synthase-like glutamine amidotransferase